MTVIWKPIETSPKDGSKFLCHEKDGNVSTVWWVGDQLGGRGWSYAEWMMPTHWRPMPPTPKQESEFVRFDIEDKKDFDRVVGALCSLIFRGEAQE
jgi:hypothetical protein